MEQKVIVNPLAGAGPAKRLLSNLFYGWGYSFYRCKGKLRADDLLIRGKLYQLLGECRAHLRSLEPAAPQALLRAQRDLEGMETAIRTSTVPDTGRVHRQALDERTTVQQLVALDGEVLLALVTLRDAIARLQDGSAAAAATGDLLRATDFDILWSRREALLCGQPG